MKLPFSLILLLASSVACGQTPFIAPNAPPDKPARLADQELAAFDLAIQPYIAQAKSTYPGAKQRFESGLPDGQSFFITTRIFETPTKFEQVFVAVQRIDGNIVHGRIWSDIELINGYHRGDNVSFPESAMIDWLITQPDGTEEGNFVGKFLDTYQQQ